MNNIGFKTTFSPYKNRKNKTGFGKNSFVENLGGEGKIKKHTSNQKKKKGYT